MLHTGFARAVLHVALWPGPLMWFMCPDPVYIQQKTYSISACCWFFLLACLFFHSLLPFWHFFATPPVFLQPFLMQALGLEWYLGMVLVQGTQQWSLFLPRRTQKIQTEHNVVLCCAAMMSFLCTHPAVETHTPDRPRLQQKCKY